MTYEFIFDLDDTLYPERDYVRSALNWAGEAVRLRFGVLDASESLWDAFLNGVKDPMGKLWHTHALPPHAKADIVLEMQAHIPEIELRPDARSLLDGLRLSGQGFSIVTDGRSITQRAKIKALGCSDAKLVSISAEVGFDKLDSKRFEAIEQALNAQSYCYVGDNPAKDFFIPNQRGWHTVMLCATDGNIHPQDVSVDIGYLAKQTIDKLTELEPVA